MEKHRDYEYLLQREEVAVVLDELRSLSLEDAKEHVNKEQARNIRQLRAEISDDQSFLGCLTLFLIYLKQFPAEDLNHVSKRKGGKGEVKVLSISELAGMTAARRLLESIDRHPIDGSNHRQVLELLHPKLASTFSEDEASVLVEGLVVYLRFNRDLLDSFSEIVPR